MGNVQARIRSDIDGRKLRFSGNGQLVCCMA
jgi:hypothetical protein